MPRNPSPYGGPSSSRGQGAHTEARSRAEESWGAVSCPTRTKLRGVVFENRLVAGAIGHREDAGEHHASLGGLGAGDGGDHGLVTVRRVSYFPDPGGTELMGLHGGCLACGGWAQSHPCLLCPSIASHVLGLEPVQLVALSEVAESAPISSDLGSDHFWAETVLARLPRTSVESARTPKVAPATLERPGAWPNTREVSTCVRLRW